MVDDIAAAQFLGYRNIVRGRSGPRDFWCWFYNVDLRATAAGRGRTRKAAERAAAAKAIDQHQQTALAAQQAIERAINANS